MTKLLILTVAVFALGSASIGSISFVGGAQAFPAMHR